LSGSPVTAVLLLSCPDQKGLVASVSDFIYRHGGNIIHADQHTDQEQGIFLQRVEWELTEFTTRFGMQWELRYSDRVPRVAVLVSRELHCLHDLLARWTIRELTGDLKAVISNHSDAQGLVEKAGLQFAHYPVTAQTKPRQEARIVQKLQSEQIDLVVLARYMQILSPQFVRRYPNAIINIHHSFLPAFSGGPALSRSLRARGQDHRRHRSLCHRRSRSGADH